MSSTSSANFPHMRTWQPASASTEAYAVPQLPVPKTATCSLGGDACVAALLTAQAWHAGHRSRERASQPAGSHEPT